MALGDIGAFSPAESHYGTPGAFDKMLQAEGLKRAAYLSSMDQFYENLAESQRQFDETLEFKTETRDLELDWARERFEKEQALDRERLSAEEKYNEGILSLKEREIGAEEDDLSPFQEFKLFNLLEKEGRERGETRDLALGKDTGYPVKATYGKDYVNPYSALQSSEVSPTTGTPSIWQQYTSAADIPGGARVTDEDRYDYP